MSINLLPEQEKSELKNKEVLKKISIVMLFVLIATLVLIFALFFLKFFLVAKIESSQKQIFQKEKELKSDLFQNFQKTIEQENQNLFQISIFRQKQILIIPILEKISSLIVSDSIYFTNFSFQKVSKEIKSDNIAKQPLALKDEAIATGKGKVQTFGQIHLSGWAKNRQELFYFKKNMEAEKNFKEIYFSPNSWVKPTDISFSLNFQTNEF
ncbi:hypothetical protein KKA09_02595 [Patescibacteria group bacterium]|nr:hypothetical protein [Patescibacteria group bacterium]